MSSLFNKEIIEKIKKARKKFLLIATIILISEIVISALFIVAEILDETTARLIGTFALCTVVLFVGVNNFAKMEKPNKVVQSFALASFIMNIIWLLLAILAIWEAFPFYSSFGFLFSSSHLTLMGKSTLISINIAILCFLVSNVWSIEETTKPVRPLKITAVVCEAYCFIYAFIIILLDFAFIGDSRWRILAVLMGFAFIVMTLAAVIISGSGKKKNNRNTTLEQTTNGNADLQAQIQEIVEKEVQARIANQQTSSKPKEDSDPVIKESEHQEEVEL